MTVRAFKRFECNGCRTVVDAAIDDNSSVPEGWTALNNFAWPDSSLHYCFKCWAPLVHTLDPHRLNAPCWSEPQKETEE